MDNQEKIENLVDELYVLHKEAGERMVKLTEDNKNTVQEVHKIQKNMEGFVKEELEEEKKGNSFIMYIILASFIIASGVYIYSMLSMRNKVNNYTEEVEERARSLHILASDMNYVMNELYKEQKKFLEDNKCNIEVNKKSTENKKKAKGK